MTDGWLVPLTLTSALGSGLVAGSFFAFSTFIMRALDDLPPGQSIEAMNAINVSVINPWFMGTLFGTGTLAVIAAIAGFTHRGEPGMFLILAGGLLYAVVTIGVTIVFNVPLNDRLAAVDPGSAAGAREWADYVSGWTAWNHVRTTGALLATAAFILGLYRNAQSTGIAD